jgi:protein TonB
MNSLSEYVNSQNIPSRSLFDMINNPSKAKRISGPAGRNPKPKENEKKKPEPTPAPITTTTGSLAATAQEPSLPASSLGGSSTGDPKTVSISQAQCSVPEPFYPNLSRRMGEEGKTMVRLFINESGAVEKVALAQSSGIHRLDQAALDAGMRVRCKPFIEFGKAIKVTAIQPYIFRLE